VARKSAPGHGGPQACKGGRRASSRSRFFSSESRFSCNSPGACASPARALPQRQGESGGEQLQAGQHGEGDGIKAQVGCSLLGGRGRGAPRGPVHISRGLRGATHTSVARAGRQQSEGSAAGCKAKQRPQAATGGGRRRASLARIRLERWYGLIVKGCASAELCIFVVTSARCFVVVEAAGVQQGGKLADRPVRKAGMLGVDLSMCMRRMRGISVQNLSTRLV
jgi:hypothetical protein